MLDIDHHAAALLRPWREGRLLLDAITVNNGPRNVLGSFFLAAARNLQAFGAVVRVHDDLTSLAEANAAIPEARGHLHPPFDIRHSHLPPDTAFWLSVHAPGGMMIGSCAAKFLEVGPGGMTGEFESLRLFYRDPAPHLAAGERCRVEGEAKAAGDAITGRVTYSGGHWTHPDYRGKGIVYAMVRLTRALAMTRWDTAYTTGIVSTDLASQGKLFPYGYRHSVPIIHFKTAYLVEGDLYFMWMRNDWLVTDLEIYESSSGEYGSGDRRRGYNPARPARPGQEKTLVADP